MPSHHRKRRKRNKRAIERKRRQHILRAKNLIFRAGELIYIGESKRARIVEGHLKKAFNILDRETPGGY